MATLKPASTFVASRAPIADKNGMPTWSFLKILQEWDTKLTNGLNQIGQLIGEINANTVITGRTEGIGTTVGNVTPTGVMSAPGLVAATDTEQGAVILPTGTVGNTLGTASTANVGDFDPTGAAASAQTAAEAHADAVAAAAQAAAEAFASNAGNISEGNLNIGQLPVEGISAVIVTAALTVGGTQGSMTFTNGVLTAQTPAT